MSTLLAVLYAVGVAVLARMLIDAAWSGRMRLDGLDVVIALTWPVWLTMIAAVFVRDWCADRWADRKAARVVRGKR